MGLVLLLIGAVVVLAVALVGLAVVLTASAALGLATAAASRKLPLRVRIALLLVVAAAPGAALVVALDIGGAWQSAAWALPFLATVASGGALLAFEAHRRRAPRIPTPAWPVRNSPAAGL
ncbi:hypothetical protein [Streptomyces sp. NPDC092307]|uniref:hypothetical protein n=1 Tax=Streptomyces sp. NPDC092307 TaxID=3366013 RepID=UPI003819B723